MAFFKFRKAGDDAGGAAAQPESVEVLRRRAKHRLIGAAVLVGIGLVGFPLVFDTQPRPVPVDIPIDIPDRNKAKPLAVPAPSASQPAKAAPAGTVVATAPAAPAKPVASAALPAKVSAAEALDPREELVPQKPASRAAAPAARTASGAIKPEPKPETKPEAKPETKPEVKAEAKPAARPASRPDDGAKARALLEGKTPDAAAAAQRFVVQVGAFADDEKAREVRQKLEKAGLKTYTHVADTKDGKRTRVRVGPFSTKADADKAAERIKGLELPAAILTL